MASGWLFPRLLTFPDDRGKRYGVTAPLRSHSLQSPESARAWNRIVGWLSVAIFLSVPLAAVAFVGWALTRDDVALRGLAIGMLMGLAWLPPVLIAILLATYRFAYHCKRRQLFSQICPGCGYSLAGLTAEEDGCTMCPECGGGWRTSTTPRSYMAPMPVAASSLRAPGRADLPRAWIVRQLTIEDDRGAHWSINAPGTAYTGRLPRRRRLCKTIRDALLAICGFIPVYLAFLAVAFVIAALLGAQERTQEVLSAPVIPTLAIALMVGARVTRRNIPFYLRALLEDSLCPVCAHSIADVEPESDGCTACRNCAAAWRRSSPGSLPAGPEASTAAADVPAMSPAAAGPVTPS